MHSLEQVLKTARRAALTLALLVTAALVASPAAQASGPRPLFQMPFACRQSLERHPRTPTTRTRRGRTATGPTRTASTSLMRDDDGDNVGEGQPVLASAAGHRARGRERPRAVECRR